MQCKYDRRADQILSTWIYLYIREAHYEAVNYLAGPGHDESSHPAGAVDYVAWEWQLLRLVAEGKRCARPGRHAGVDLNLALGGRQEYICTST